MTLPFNNLFKTTLKIFLFLFLAIPFSCQQDKFRCKDSCCGETYDQQKTKIKAMSIEVGSIETIQKSSYESQDYSSDTTTNYKKAAIKIYVSDFDRVATSQPQKKDFNFSVISSAVACSFPYFVPTQKITSIIITSNDTIKSGNDTFKPEENINELFYVFDQYPEYMSIEDYVEMNKDNNYGYSDYGGSIIFQLYQKITIKNQTITISLKTDDEEEFVLTTDEFIVN